MVSSLNQRRNWNTILTLLCLIYSGYISLQILTKLSTPSVCRYEPPDDDDTSRFDVRDVAGDVMYEENTPRRELRKNVTDKFGSGKYIFQTIEDDLITFSKSDNIENDVEGRFKLAQEKEKKLSEMIETNYFGCSDLDIIPRTRKKVEENFKGNRGVSFLRIRIDGVTLSVVLKEASRNFQTAVDEYKYNSAKKEILYLRKLRGLRGIPKLYGSCIEQIRIRYLVERVDGTKMCRGNGTTPRCATGEYIEGLVATDPHPDMAALSLAYSTVTLFKQLEDRHLFMEDVSGLNFMISREWELYMVDADSLVFYNDSRIYSQIYCSVDNQCPEPRGNLWVPNSLNVRIYENCDDHKGLCNYRRCRGFGSELHGCGFANWYLCRLARFFAPIRDAGEIYADICMCLSNRSPYNRCSFNEVEKKLRKLYFKHYRDKAKSLNVIGNSKDL